jgi:hypothetical protein
MQRMLQLKLFSLARFLACFLHFHLFAVVFGVWVMVGWPGEGGGCCHRGEFLLLLVGYDGTVCAEFIVDILDGFRFKVGFFLDFFCGI